MIEYRESLDGIQAHQLEGFFSGWPNPPSVEAHLRILQGSDYVELAFDPERNRVIGFITAISDHVSCAYIPHLEVLEEWRGHGIGKELVRRMLARLSGFYMIDLTCDPEVQPFYRQLGMRMSTGMCIRNYNRQNCQ